MWLNRTLELLGAKFKERADGWDRYVYALPTGEDVTVKGERWWYGDQCGEGSDVLWALAWPKVQSHRAAREAAATAKADAAYAKVRAIVERAAQHLRDLEWGGEIRVSIAPTNQFCKYGSISVYDGSHCEVWLDFQEDGTIRTGAVCGTYVSGIPTLLKQLKRRYEFDVKAA